MTTWGECQGDVGTEWAEGGGGGPFDVVNNYPDTDAHFAVGNAGNTKLAFPFTSAPDGALNISSLKVTADVVSKAVSAGDQSPLNNFLLDIEAAIYNLPPASVTPGVTSAFATWAPFPVAGLDDEYFSVNAETGECLEQPPFPPGTDCSSTPTGNPLDLSGVEGTNADVWTIVFFDNYETVNADSSLEYQVQNLSISISGDTA